MCWPSRAHVEGHIFFAGEAQGSSAFDRSLVIDDDLLGLAVNFDQNGGVGELDVDEGFGGDEALGGKGGLAQDARGHLGEGDWVDGGAGGRSAASFHVTNTL